jgi:hypothetical protein
MKNLETAPGPAYLELEERLGPHGDVCDVDLRYNHPENSVRKGFHGSIYLAYLRKLQENVVKRFPSYDILVAFCVALCFLVLASEAAMDADYGRTALKCLLDHYGSRIAKGDLS